MRNVTKTPGPSLGEDLNILDAGDGGRMRADQRMLRCQNGHVAPKAKDGRCLFCKRETDARSARLYRARKAGRVA